MRPNKLPNVLTEDEQKRLLEQPNPRYVTGQRNYTLMRLMLNTGLRLSEATGLKWENVNLNSGKLEVVEGKGGKDRILWISEEDLELLRSWRERQVDKAGKKLEFVFTAMSDGTIGNRLDNRYVQDMVKRYAKKAKINNSTTPHVFRHTFATTLYSHTKNIRLVQKALGHNQLSTTMIYTHIVDDELEDALKNFKKKEQRGVN